MARFRNSRGREVSFTRIDPEVLRDDRLNARAKLAYAILRTYANNEGECWPEYKTLARHAKCSKSSVYRALIELEKNGDIERIHRRGTSTFYKTVWVQTPVTGDGGQAQAPTSPVAEGEVTREGPTPVTHDRLTRSIELDPQTRTVKPTKDDEAFTECPEEYREILKGFSLKGIPK